MEKCVAELPARYGCSFATRQLKSVCLGLHDSSHLNPHLPEPACLLTISNNALGDDALPQSCRIGQALPLET